MYLNELNYVWSPWPVLWTTHCILKPFSDPVIKVRRKWHFSVLSCLLQQSHLTSYLLLAVRLWRHHSHSYSSAGLIRLPATALWFDFLLVTQVVGSCSLCLRFLHLKTGVIGPSQVVQWLRVCTSTAGGMGLIPGWGTRILYTVWLGKKQKKEIKKK